MSDLRDRFIAKLKAGHRYTLHRCSICNFPCQWFSVSGNLYYDAACDCVRYGEPRSELWTDLDQYFDPSWGHSENFEKWINEGKRNE